MHGHVTPRPDGAKARCGGPGICTDCTMEQLRAEARQPSIVHRQLDASRRELHSMTSEIEHYGEEFSGPQLLAMRDTMRALKKLIEALEA